MPGPALGAEDRDKKTEPLLLVMLRQVTKSYTACVCGGEGGWVTVAVVAVTWPLGRIPQRENLLVFAETSLMGLLD